MSHQSYKKFMRMYSTYLVHLFLQIKKIKHFKKLSLWLQKLLQLSQQMKKLHKLYWIGVARLFSFGQEGIVQWVFFPRSVGNELLMFPLPPRWGPPSSEGILYFSFLYFSSWLPTHPTAGETWHYGCCGFSWIFRGWRELSSAFGDYYTINCCVIHIMP